MRRAILFTIVIALSLLSDTLCRRPTQKGYEFTKDDVETAEKLRLEDDRVEAEHDIMMPESIMAKGTQPWPDAKVFYFVPQNEFSAMERGAIVRAFCEIEKVSCVRFIPISELPYTGNYVYFQRGKPGECTSYVGMIGGKQDLTLEHMLKPNEIAEKCFRGYGNVIHELIHAIGSWHEHARLDRAKYVNISESAIFREPANYAVQSPPTQNYGGENQDPGYDLDSIMHYGTVAGKLIARDRDHTPRIGQRKLISPKDVEKLRSWNKCTTRPIPPLSKYC